MKEQDKNTQTELIFQAVLAEYNAIRAASLLRDQMRGSLENLMILILSAVIVGLPTIIDRQQFMLMPIISVASSIIALNHVGQGWLMNDLALYEKSVLRPKLLEIIQGKNEIVRMRDTNGVWDWQNYIRRRTLNGRMNFLLRSLSVSLEPLFIIVSIGFILLFVYYRNLTTLSILEMTLFILAIISSAVYVLALIYMSIQDVISNNNKPPIVK